MFADKMLRVLDLLEKDGITPRNVWIGCTSGGELQLEIRGQPSKAVHDRLLKVRFIYFNGIYIYRP